MPDIQADALLRRIQEAFPVQPLPSPDRVALHDCRECSELRDAFARRVWTELDSSVLEAHADNIALLSPDAFFYYVPAFMSEAVRSPEEPGVGASNALDFSVQALCDPGLPEDEWWSQRVARLLPSQRQVVASFLEWVLHWIW